MKPAILFTFCILALMPALAHAQGGCVDSPENPTPILALVGGVGVSLAYLWKRKSE